MRYSRPCTHRVRGIFGESCTHPKVFSPRRVVHRGICDHCRFADNGIRTVEPRRLDKTPRGLGDTVHDGLRIIGIKQKQGCPCPKREAWLNQHVSYGRLPTLAREGKTWANWLCKLLGIKTGLEPQDVLFRFPHGLGDAVQFTVALQYVRRLRPRDHVRVVGKRGMASLFRGLADETVELESSDRVMTWQPLFAPDQDVFVDWLEPEQDYPDSPGTKAERYVREALGVTEMLPLSYHVVTAPVPRPVPGPYVLFHYQGNTAVLNKDLEESTAIKVVDEIIAAGMSPVILDWDNRSVYARGRRSGAVVVSSDEYADAAAIAGLARQAELCVGIDSGPGHVMVASGARTLLVWGAHHPYHYCCPAQNATHLVPRDHAGKVGRMGLGFFRRAYRYAELDDPRRDVPRVVRESLSGLDVSARSKRTCARHRDVVIRRNHWHNDAGMVDEVISDDCYGVRSADFPRDVRTVLDIGAHVGSFAVLIKRCRRQAEVYCVEVNRRNLAALRANCHGEVRHAAVTYESDVELRVGGRRGLDTGPGDCEVVPIGAAMSCKRHVRGVVPGTVTIEELLDERGWPVVDVLKLDCEGSEWSILENMDVSRVKMIVGEYHDGRARLEDVAARRFPHLSLRVLSDKMPSYDHGTFWLCKS